MLVRCLIRGRLEMLPNLSIEQTTPSGMLRMSTVVGSAPMGRDHIPRRRMSAPHALVIQASPMKLIASLLTAIALLSDAQAQEFKPFPRANITEAQWQRYFDEVREKHGASAQDLDDQKLLVYTDGTTSTVYGFTKPGHPAHPAWIARKPEQRGDSIYVGQIGYFAGAEPPFAKLFKEYLALNEKLKEEMKRRQAEGAAK